VQLQLLLLLLQGLHLIQQHIPQQTAETYAQVLRRYSTAMWDVVGAAAAAGPPPYYVGPASFTSATHTMVAQVSCGTRVTLLNKRHSR
jgi:hypothetical protein